MASDLLSLLRPSQWIKNAFVLAPLVFSQRIFEEGRAGAALWACLAFCLASSASYVFNDIIDRRRDAVHPLKRDRALASGRVASRLAYALTGVLALVSLAMARALGPGFIAVLGAFLALQVAYSLWLKEAVLVDATAISGGFLLRTLGGALAVGARMSAWLFLCTFLLAMFLALAKRRHEIVLLGSGAEQHRGVLGRYSATLLDQVLTVLAATTIAAYTAYSMWPGVAEKLGTTRLYLTVPFVVIGLLRYLFLVHGRAEGEPTKVLLADLPLQTSIVLWLAAAFALLYG